MRPAAPSSEIDRVSALRGYDIPEGGSDALLDELTELAAAACGAPIALLGLVDRDRVWFKSQVGLDLGSVAREEWFCDQTVLGADVFVVGDAREDDRFASSSMVDVAEGLRFYAGAPLLSADGVAFGALCVLDRIPRELSDDQELALRVLARQAVMQFELRRTREALTQSERRFQSIIEEANEAYIAVARLRAARELRLPPARDGLADRRLRRSRTAREELGSPAAQGIRAHFKFGSLTTLQQARVVARAHG